MTAQGERRLQHALRDFVSALSASGAPWMVIGGIAVIARGVRRFTADIDAAVRGDQVELTALLRSLAKKRILPRIDDAEQFARENLVLLVRHVPSGADLDISLACTNFEHEAIAASTVAAFGSVKAPMARPEDLIVFKSIAGRGKDIDDMTTLLALYPLVDIARVRSHVRELAEAAEMPELAAGLEKAIAAAARGRTTSSSATREKRKRGAGPEQLAPAKRTPKNRPKKRSRISSKSGRATPEKPSKTR